MKVANITLERKPSQATELLGTEVVTRKEAAGEDNIDREPSHNQMENELGKQYQKNAHNTCHASEGHQGPAWDNERGSSTDAYRT